MFHPAALLLAPALLASDPVGSVWADWGPGVLDRARREGRPLVLVIGDRACRPCREAEGLALSDPAVDERMRASFVGSRADRHDRPDLDDVFGTAAVALHASRAYPLAVFLTPEGAPFAAQGGFGRDDGDEPGLARLLLRRASDFTRDRAGAAAAGDQALAALGRAQQTSPASGGLQPALLARLRDGLVKGGGPSLTGVLFLLDQDQRARDPEALRAARAALEALAEDGRPPGSLAETALCLEAHARAFAAEGGATDRDRAAALAGGALRELRDAAGGFRASRDPDEDRVLAAGNGLMIGALAAAGEALDQPELKAAARDAAHRVLERLGPASRLAHGARGPVPYGTAFLDDYAALAGGLLALDEADGGKEPELREAAAALLDAAVGRFLDPRGGGFFLTEATPDSLPVRPRSAFDTEAPSGNGLMAMALQRLARATGRSSEAALACRTVEAFAGDLERAPRGLETLARAAAACLARPREPDPPSVPLAARVTAGPLTLVASVAPDRVRLGEAFEARVRVEVAAGWRVVAADSVAKDLVPLAVSAVGRRSASAPRGCEGRSEPGPYGTEALLVVEGACERVLPLRLASPADVAGQTRVRLHVLFQACQGARCQPPQAVRLEVPLTALPAAGGR